MSEKKPRRLFKPGDYQMRVLSAGWRRADNGTIFLQVIGAVYAYIKPSKRGELIIAEDFQVVRNIFVFLNQDRARALCKLQALGWQGTNLADIAKDIRERGHGVRVTCTHTEKDGRKVEKWDVRVFAFKTTNVRPDEGAEEEAIRLLTGEAPMPGFVTDVDKPPPKEVLVTDYKLSDIPFVPDPPKDR